MINIKGAAVGLGLFAFLCFLGNQITGAFLANTPGRPDPITTQIISGVSSINAGLFWGWVLPVVLLGSIVVLRFVRGDQ